jgi:hypothetical protein|tara:strand:- start:3472 stop:4275 length:804 start_codon:yes stop_codon:yes gene_type:complete
MFKTNKNKNMSNSMQDKFDLISSSTFKREHSTVWVTNDYDQFSFIEENRPTSASHVSNIQESIAVKQLPVPIVVDEQYRICDGQHRFLACKNLNKPIYFVQVHKMTIEDIQRLNADTKVWSLDDFLASYCKRNKSEYLKYRDFKERYKFGHGECLLLLSGWKKHNSVKSVNQNFKDGNFKIINYGEAVNAADKINRVKEYFLHYKTRWFVAALVKCFKNEEYDHDIFIKKLSGQSAKLMKQADTDSYLINIEMIYNYNNSNKISLRF